ncbi:MAG TPA: hypothetical protein VKC66_26035 [Xanthobacteraceae bacterium]|nr:hypothetical protein [Xanthobacteraceae bacterium]
MTAMLPTRSHMAASHQEVARLERLLRRKTFEIEVLEEALTAARAKIEMGFARADGPDPRPDRPARS